MEDKLTEHFCHVFTDLDKLYSAYKNLHNPPDLFVIDYTLYNHEIFNLTDYMNDVHYRIPSIFYNDPCLIAGNRPDHWQHLIRITYGYKDTQNPEEYYEVFKQIASVVEDPDIAQYVPLMQKPKLLPENFYVTKMFKDTAIKEARHRLLDFKIKTKMPDNLFFIMELLFINEDKAISLEEIQKEYSKEIRNITIESLSVQISKLKKILKDNPQANYAIIKQKKGYRFLAF